MRPRAIGLRFSRTASTLFFLSSLLVAPVVSAQPAGYYGSVDTSNGPVLRSTLHEVIDDHTRFPYTASSTDTWDILNLADEDPNDINRVVDVYKNVSYGKISGGVGDYNREHSWPKSYGFPQDGNDNSAYTDCHHLFVSDASYNSARSNKPFRNCTSGCSEYSTTFTDGRGGSGDSNWSSGSYTQGTWETWSGRKGDVARAMFYMDLRYEGGSHGVTGYSEPDLRLTDDENLIDQSNTGSNRSVAYMGMLSVLLQWHIEDPVDARELYRNEIVYGFQGNRNPFIDNPHWAQCIYQGVQCSGTGGGDTTPPAAPGGLSATAGVDQVDLSWNANGESDLAGYNVYRSATSGGPYTKLNGPFVSQTSYTDSAAAGGSTYYYVVAAVDTSGNISGDSAEASASPTSGGGGGGGGGGGNPTGDVILAEVVYDVSSGDDGWEWVELYNRGTETVDLSGWSLGNGGTSYTTSKVQLSGSIAPGATFLVGGPSSGGTNGAPSFDQVYNFSPDFQNSGTTGDGVALFDVPASSITGSTVPVDAVIYGPNNNSGLIDETGSAGAPEVGDASPGSSIERTDLAGSWRIQGSPTPGSVPFSSGPTNNAPTVSITAPANGTTVTVGDLVSFAATASDVEDGNLASSLTWTSDRDGQIGSGASFQSSALSVGMHTITASVTDAGGLAGSDGITVTVEDVLPPNTAPSVTISGPADGSVFVSGDTVSFAGSASDVEDGNLASSLSWSSNLDGAIGSGGSFQTAGLSVGVHVVTATVTDSGGLSAVDTVTVEVLQVSGPVTVTLTSIAADDGWLQESSENSSVGGRNNSSNNGTGALRVGDNKSDRQYKALVSFDTSSIPAGATITSVTLRLRRGTVSGTNPFAGGFGQCEVDVKSGAFSGSAALENGDFEALATAPGAGVLSNPASNGDWAEASLSAAGLAAIQAGGLTQLRLGFQLGDNDDRGNDYVGFYSANNSNAANHPQLVVTYQ